MTSVEAAREIASILRADPPLTAAAEMIAVVAVIEQRRVQGEERIARENCLLRGREIARGEAEPELSTNREALVQLWISVPQADRDRINAKCEEREALLKREG